MLVNKHPAKVWTIIITAFVFGVMTIKSGGSVLFINGEARLAAGNYVDFVLWFNFVAGFFYVATGLGIYLKKTWAATVAVFIAVLTLLVFAAFGLHILNDGAYETRTVLAMTLRSFVWIVIATLLSGNRSPAQT